MSFEIINPESLGAPRGWSHGMLAKPGGRVLFVAGQTAAGASGEVGSLAFVDQFGRALRHVLAVVEAAGGTPEDVGRMTIYVTDIDAYRSSLRELGEVYRALMGYHFPAMALVQVTSLVNPEARVEIEATASI